MKPGYRAWQTYGLPYNNPISTFNPSFCSHAHLRRANMDAKRTGLPGLADLRPAIQQSDFHI